MSDQESFPFEVRSKFTKIGGRLADFLPQWEHVSQNKTVLSYIRGAKVIFHTEPSADLSLFRSAPPDTVNSKECLDFITNMEAAQIIERVQVLPDQVVSPIFFVTNNDTSIRFIFNMKRLNKECIRTTRFKLETLQLLLPLIAKNSWFTSWDIVQGFYNVLIHESQRKFFCFEWHGVRYQFRALPMGCSESPRIFSKVVRAAIYAARSLGINVFSYIDDTLVTDFTYQLTYERSFQFARLLTRLGFLLHPKKSVLIPTQQIKYLGMIIDSVSMTVALPKEKVDSLYTLIDKLVLVTVSRRKESIRAVAKVIGFLISCTPATRYGKAHYRALEFARDGFLSVANRNFDQEFVWPLEILSDLFWWRNLITPIAHSFDSLIYSDFVVTDASLTGWAGVFGDQVVHHSWDYNDSENDIALLELKAILLTLQYFFSSSSDRVIHLRTDNTVAKCYVNNMGGRILRFDQMARRIWRFLEERNSFVTAFFVPSEFNEADEFTRPPARHFARYQDTEMKLNTVWFQKACQLSPEPFTIDWFASDDNFQVDRFCAWESSKFACVFDAFSHSWSDEVSYIFPPFSLIPRVLKKIQDDRAKGVMVLPLWTGSNWWNLAMSLSLTTFQIPQPRPVDFPRFPGLAPSRPADFLLLCLFSIPG